DPFIHVDAVDLQAFVRLPVAHVESVRHDAGAGAQFLEQSGAKLDVDRLQKIKRHHRGRADIDGENVVLDEIDEIFHTGPAGKFHRVGNPDGVNVDADAMRVAFLGCRDQDPTIAGPQI